MEVRIGIAESAQALTVSLAEDADRDSLKAQIDKVMAGKESVLWITDNQGREFAVASGRITYAEIGPSGSHPIGFG